MKLVTHAKIQEVSFTPPWVNVWYMKNQKMLHVCKPQLRWVVVFAMNNCQQILVQTIKSYVQTHWWKLSINACPIVPMQGLVGSDDLRFSSLASDIIFVDISMWHIFSNPKETVTRGLQMMYAIQSCVKIWFLKKYNVQLILKDKRVSTHGIITVIKCQSYEFAIWCNSINQIIFILSLVCWNKLHIILQNVWEWGSLGQQTKRVHHFYVFQIF